MQFCDTEYAFTEGSKMSLDDIVSKVAEFRSDYVCVTGGEPLVQKEVFELMNRLCDMGLKVSVETSGAYSCEPIDKRVKKIVDIKTPGSGEGKSFLLDNLEFLSSDDELKFVITSHDDFDWTVDFVEKYRLTDKCTVLISPNHKAIDYKWLAESVLTRLPKVRLQLQMHKFIWPEQERGV